MDTLDGIDKLTLYQNCLQALLTSYAVSSPTKPESETQILIDSVRHHYQLMRVGWQGLQRVYHVILHFDIKDGKVWIQQNMTDSDVAAELMDAGIAREDIVLGLQPAYKRPLSGFAVP